MFKQFTQAVSRATFKQDLDSAVFTDGFLLVTGFDVGVTKKIKKTTYFEVYSITNL